MTAAQNGGSAEAATQDGNVLEIGAAFADIKERFTVDKVRDSGPDAGVALEDGKFGLTMKKARVEEPRIERPWTQESETQEPKAEEQKVEAWGPKSISEWASMDIDETATLLGDRWLCRHGLACVVASSGQGKSVMSIQCGILWGCGKEAFGITPPNPLRVMVIQGEDDEGDVIEMARMIGALDLSDEEFALVEMNTLVGRKNATGRAFIKFLEEAAADFKPDLVILNPLNNYIGSDDKDAKAWVDFRDKLYRVMKEHDFGMLLFHHTPKTNFQSTSNFATQDWQYRGAGAAGITNSIRASIIMDPVPGKENVGTYRFIGAKRGGRCGAGWTRGESGCHERFFKHTTEPGLLMWEDAEPVVREGKKAVDVNALMDKILALVPKDGMKGKADIEMEARQTFGAGRDQVRDCLRALQERGLIFTWKLPKPKGAGPGSSPQGWSRSEQSEEAVPKDRQRTKK